MSSVGKVNAGDRVSYRQVKRVDGSLKVAGKMHGGLIFKLDMRLTDQKVGEPRVLELPVPDAAHSRGST